MIRSIDTLSTLARYDLDRKFDLERWKEYIDAWIPGISTNIIDDVRIYDFKNDFMFKHSLGNDQDPDSFYLLNLY